MMNDRALLYPKVLTIVKQKSFDEVSLALLHKAASTADKHLARDGMLIKQLAISHRNFNKVMQARCSKNQAGQIKNARGFLEQFQELYATNRDDRYRECPCSTIPRVYEHREEGGYARR
jgi:hypothetical protein